MKWDSTDLFTPVFAIARVAGWLAHWKEQLAENRIFRPTQVYNGLQNALHPYRTTLVSREGEEASFFVN